MTKNEYNGWYNYETWVVNLWMDNEEGSYRYWGEVAGETFEEAVADKNFTQVERAKLDLSDRLKEYHEDARPELGGVFGDLLSATMSEVNWYEIAEHLIDNYVQDKPAEAENK